MTNKLRKGDVVMIYLDPITEKTPEGQARLLARLVKDDGAGLERWRVRFLSNRFGCGREVRTRTDEKEKL